jgi:hypothetical protein
MAAATATLTAVAGQALFARIVPSERLQAERDSLAAHVAQAGLTLTDMHTGTGLSCTPARGVHFTNICGKIDHYDVLSVTQPAIQPYVKRHTDAFGTALCVYSSVCSLRTSTALTSTLYRGGGDSAKMAVVFEHAILPATVRSNTVHMLVASCRLGRPVLMRSLFLIAHLEASPHWTCTQCVDDGETHKYHSAKLTDFDAAWLASHGVDGPLRPSTCLVNVCRTGTVNLFATISPSVPFEVGIEEKYRSMFEHVASLVAAAT